MQLKDHPENLTRSGRLLRHERRRLWRTSAGTSKPSPDCALSLEVRRPQKVLANPPYHACAAAIRRDAVAPTTHANVTTQVMAKHCMRRKSRCWRAHHPAYNSASPAGS